MCHIILLIHCFPSHSTIRSSNCRVATKKASEGERVSEGESGRNRVIEKVRHLWIILTKHIKLLTMHKPQLNGSRLRFILSLIPPPHPEPSLSVTIDSSREIG